MDKSIKAELTRKEANKAERKAIAYARLRQGQLRFERTAMTFRVLVYGEEGKLLRPMLERRTVEKYRTAEKQSPLCGGCEAVDGLTLN